MRDPQVSCQINGIRDRVVGGESGRHQYAQHVFFSKGFCCQCGNEGRINSPGKSEYGFREPVFVEEIFYSEDKCIVNKSNGIRSFFFEGRKSTQGLHFAGKGSKLIVYVLRITQEERCKWAAYALI